MIDTIIRFFYGFNPIPDSQTFTSSYPEFRFLSYYSTKSISSSR